MICVKKNNSIIKLQKPHLFFSEIEETIVQVLKKKLYIE